MEDIVIVGFGGHAKSIVDCIEREEKYRIVGYIDAEKKNVKYQYLGNDHNLEECFKRGIQNAVIGIGYMGRGNVRERIFAILKEIGFNLPVIIDPSAVVSKTAKIDEGTFIGKNAVINSEARIGKMVIINTQVLVEHECMIDDFSHIAVAAVLCGQVKVGKSAFIGANATVIQNRTIRDRQLIPAGVVVR